MSIELKVYSIRPVLTRETLARECRSSDLPEKIRWEICFLRPAENQADPDQIGLLREDQSIAGWSTLSKNASQLRDTFAINEKKILDRMYDLEAYGIIDLSVVTPFSEGWASLEEPDALEGIPEEFRDTVRKASSLYILETHAHRNDMSLELQQYLRRMIGVLTGGTIEDPQGGGVENCAEDSEH